MTQSNGIGGEVWETRKRWEGVWDTRKRWGGVGHKEVVGRCGTQERGGKVCRTQERGGEVCDTRKRWGGV